MSGIKEECGVLAAWAPEQNIAPLLYLGLYALQHRGQEGAGMALSSGRGLTVRRRPGLVPQVFSSRWLGDVAGDRGIGHVRYSTAGSLLKENLQPIVRGKNNGSPLALAHNGNLLRSDELRLELLGRGIDLWGDADSELILALLEEKTLQGLGLAEAMKEVAPSLFGAWSLVVLSPKEIIAARDPRGFRPLSLGRLGLGYAVASETCALDIIGAQEIREVQPGECLRINREGLKSFSLGTEKIERRSCLFEDIYFSRPDSLLSGRRVYESRKEMGRILAREAPVEADVVVGVPDSGTPAAAGYALESGLLRDEGLVKNRYVARTFIEPGQDVRRQDVAIKFNPIPEVVRDKRVVLVDDSLVRGNTTKALISLLRSAGASQVHLRISSPAIRFPCYFGIDMPDSSEMIASGLSAEEIAKVVGADSLAYLSLEGVFEASQRKASNSCTACFTGDYPLT